MSKEIVLSVKKQKNKYIVETNVDKYSFTEDTIIKFSIFKGSELDEEKKQEIIKEEEINVLTNKAINYLGFQPRSESELRKYLLEKVENNEVIEVIIEKIKSLGYLDDEALANSFLDYVKRNLKGPNVLRQKLILKSIDEELIDNVVRKYTEIEEENIIDSLLEKLVEKYKKHPKNKQKGLIFQKLIRDGFTNELVNYKLYKLAFIDESDETLKKDLKNMLKRVSEFDYQTRNKIISKLLSKGYEYNKIINALNNLE